ncbi:MAG: DUF2185 domain-containing protein [Methanococcaceae archaeon]|jgi:hypothetical protein
MINIFKRKTNENSNYKFRDPENSACIICDHVLNKERPVLYVTYDLEDGGWQFMCGQEDHDESSGKVISLKEVTEIDNSINDLYEMPSGIGAERKSVQEKWIPFKLNEE